MSRLNLFDKMISINIIVVLNSKLSHKIFMENKLLVETTLDLTCNVVACVDSECSDLTQACVGRKRRSADPVNAQIYQVKAQAKLVNV